MSASDPHGVFIRVKVKPEKREEFVRLVTQLAHDVKAHEPDTLVFEFMQTADPLEFLFFERFTDKAAYQRHQDAPYHVAMSPLGWACLDGDPSIETLTPIAP